jgi:hypothetical protein
VLDSWGGGLGRARVPARREQGYVINLDKRRIWSVLGFAVKVREDPTSPNALEENATPQKGYVGQAAILPGHQSACVTTTKNEAPTFRARGRF